MGWSTDTYHFLLYNCNILSVVLHLVLCFYGTVLQNFTLFWFKYPHILLIYVHTIYQLFQITIFHKISNELLWQNCYVWFFCIHSAGTWDILIPYALQFSLIWHLTCKLQINSHQTLCFRDYWYLKLCLGLQLSCPLLTFSNTLSLTSLMLYLLLFDQILSWIAHAWFCIHNYFPVSDEPFFSWARFLFFFCFSKFFIHIKNSSSFDIK